MKLHLGFLLSIILVATASAEVLAPDSTFATKPRGGSCGTVESRRDMTWKDVEQRILADGYTEVRLLAKSCDDVWHAAALAEGDPVMLRVTPNGAVSTE